MSRLYTNSAMTLIGRYDMSGAVQVTANTRSILYEDAFFYIDVFSMHFPDTF